MLTPTHPRRERICHDGVCRTTIARSRSIDTHTDNRKSFQPNQHLPPFSFGKDRAESQQVISIGGESFEQGEREGTESEYRVGPFFKAWVASCGILTKLAAGSLQADFTCSLFIYTMTLHDLSKKLSWQGVKGYHFQFHRKRIASGKEIYFPDDCRKLDQEPIATKCFLFPTPATSTTPLWPNQTRSGLTGQAPGVPAGSPRVATGPLVGPMAVPNSRIIQTSSQSSVFRD